MLTEKAKRRWADPVMRWLEEQCGPFKECECSYSGIHQIRGTADIRVDWYAWTDDRGFVPVKGILEGEDVGSASN